jgi:drug/metabolite transporter (DMT)-like permease
LPVDLTMGRREWALLGALSLIWGSSFLMNAVALAELPPFTVVLGRIVPAALALVLWLRARGQRLPNSGRILAVMFLLGLINNLVPFSLIVWGQTRIPSGLAAILNASMPLWSVVLAHFATTDERLTPARGAGVVLGFLGVAVLIGPSLLAGGGDLLGRLAVLGAAFCYASSAIVARRLLRGVPAPVAATGQALAATCLILPVVLVVDRPWTLAWPSLPVWGAVLWLSLLSTALAYLIFYRLLATAGATNTSLVTFLVPVTAVLLGVLVLGEPLALRQLGGMALIGLGLAVLDGRPLRHMRRRLAPAVPGG